MAHTVYLQCLVLVVAWVKVGSLTGRCFLDADVPHIKRDTIIEGSAFITLTDYGVFGCAKHCLLRSACQSFNYNLNTSVCQLNLNTSDSTAQSGGNVTSVKGILSSDIASWPRRMTGGCRYSVCPKNTVCQEEKNGSTHCLKECPDPPPVRNGLITSNISRETGSILDHSCFQNYVKYGQAVCKPTGEWSDFGCVEGCVNPPSISDATLFESDKVWLVGSILNYTCKPPLVQLGRVQCKLNLNWTLMQCIPVIRNCSQLKQCNSNYNDGEYWLVPDVYIDKPAKIYCHDMKGNNPRHYITLIENNNVEYSDFSCSPTIFSGCQSTRFEKVRINDVSQMKMIHAGLRDRRFVNDSNPCTYIQFGSAYDCNALCGRSNSTAFAANTKYTGVKINPNQEWTAEVDNTKLNTPVTIVRSDKGRVIHGECHQPCKWCYPTNNIFTFTLDDDFLPEISSAIVPLCK